jgi:CPA2 family monovalent cation:H+ antiporter-2
MVFLQATDAVGAPVDVVLVELGAAITALALLGRLAARVGISPIPLYLLGGLAFGRGGIVPLDAADDVLSVGSEIGAVLLLFMLGLSYTAAELAESTRSHFKSGLVDFALNAPVGVIAGRIAGWPWSASLLMGGVTFVTSSGIASKLLADLKWTENPETPAVVSVLVLEDLSLAFLLPVLAITAEGTGANGATKIVSSITAVCIALWLALKAGPRMSTWVKHRSREVMLLTMFGAVLLVSGGSHRVGISATVGAFLLGLAVTGSVAAQMRALLAPLRDLFAALFFFFFALRLDPHGLIPVLLPATALAVVSGLTKVATGWLAAARETKNSKARLRAGLVLIPRGEFSIVIAGLAVAMPNVASVAAAYVLITAIAGPVAIRLIPDTLLIPAAKAAT